MGAVFVWLLSAALAAAQTVQPPYDASYTLTSLGAVPGLPPSYGGLTFLPSNSNVIVIGGAANAETGALYTIGVIRGTGNHITGFTGSAAVYSEGQYNDGGVVFGPSGVLFYTRHPLNQIGQIEAGSAVNDKIVDLTPLGVASSVGALNIVPAGFPGAGQMKVASYNTSKWYTVTLSADGTGTFNIDTATENTTIQGGPEGFVYVPPGSPLFTDYTNVLVSEYQNAGITTYQIDAGGNPVLASRAVFISGLAQPEGAATDPVTGDFLVSTFAAGHQVIVVKGFAPPATATPTVTLTSTPPRRPRPPLPPAPRRRPELQQRRLPPLRLRPRARPLLRRRRRRGRLLASHRHRPPPRRGP